jgi:DNA-binding NtrC family response regulator
MNRKSILVVDDEEEVLAALQTFLELHKFRVKTCRDPLKALELMRRGSFQLALLDINMPGMDGVALLGRIKALRPSTQAIMMTAFSTLGNVKACLDAGAADYIMKPFVRLDEILSIITLTCERIERWENAGSRGVESVLERRSAP